MQLPTTSTRQGAITQWHLVGWCLLAMVARLTDAQPLFYAAQSPDAVYLTTSSINGVNTNHVDDAYWSWIPKANSKKTGVIFYTHSFYDERAYARIMQKMAESGYPSFLLDIPWSVPYLTPFRGDLVLRDYPNITNWVAAGHGTGGSMASIFAQRRRRERVNGLALFGSHPFPLFNDQSLTDIKAISIWGNLDGITPRIKWEDGRKWLPPNAKFKEVDGANHSQMARLQVDVVSNDNPATITRDAQENIVVAELRGLMAWVESGTEQPTAGPTLPPVPTSPPAATIVPAAPTLRPTVKKTKKPTKAPTSKAPTPK